MSTKDKWETPEVRASIEAACKAGHFIPLRPDAPELTFDTVLPAPPDRPTLHITQGLPGCGKSTWARAWQTGVGAETRVRINRDDLRRMLWGKWTGRQDDEGLVTAMAQGGLSAALLNGRDVVMDATHTRARDLARMISLGTYCKVRIVIHRWDTRPVPCILRDRQRPAVERVGADVIWDMYGAWRRESAEHARLSTIADEVIIHE